VSMIDDMLRIVDQIERVDPFVDARRYAVVFMSRDRYWRLVQAQLLTPSREPIKTAFGYPIRVEDDGPDEPIAQFRMTPSQLVDLIEAGRRREVFMVPPAPPAPTLKAVVRKWWKRYRPS
jgi:hypothetical protein